MGPLQVMGCHIVCLNGMFIKLFSLAACLSDGKPRRGRQGL